MIFSALYLRVATLLSELGLAKGDGKLRQIYGWLYLSITIGERRSGVKSATFRTGPEPSTQTYR